MPPSVQQQQTGLSKAQTDALCADFAGNHFSQEPEVTHQFFLNISFLPIEAQPAVPWGSTGAPLKHVEGICSMVRFDRNGTSENKRYQYSYLTKTIETFIRKRLQRADGVTPGEIEHLCGEELEKASKTALVEKYKVSTDIDLKSLSESQFEHLRQLSFHMPKAGWTCKRGPSGWCLRTQSPVAQQATHRLGVLAGEPSGNPATGQQSQTPHTQVVDSSRYLIDRVLWTPYTTKQRPVTEPKAEVPHPSVPQQRMAHTPGMDPWSDLTDWGVAYGDVGFNMSALQGYVPNTSGTVHGYGGGNAAGTAGFLLGSNVSVPPNSTADPFGTSHGYGGANAVGFAGSFPGANMSVPWNDVANMSGMVHGPGIGDVGGFVPRSTAHTSGTSHGYGGANAVGSAGSSPGADMSVPSNDMANTFGMMHGHDGEDVWGSAGSVPMLNMSAPRNHLTDPFSVVYGNSTADTGVVYYRPGFVPGTELRQTTDQINPSAQADAAGDCQQ